MNTVFVTSLSPKSGKTMISAGLGKEWLSRGKKVGYIKIVGPEESGRLGTADKDAVFIHKLFDLQGPVEAVCLPSANLKELKVADQSASQEKDITIVETLFSNISNRLESLDGKVLVVHDYSDPLQDSLLEYKKLGKHLLGVLINKVPRKDMQRIGNEISDQFSQAGIKFSGLVPEDRILVALSVSDMAGAVKGKILNNEESSSELIENMMLGSSTFDRGAAYYSRKNNKAVILWGERPGFRKAVVSNYQLAALQTSTRCIVISASGTPLPAVAEKAQEQKVPLISAPGTIPELLAGIEDAMVNLQFTQENKLARLKEILNQNLKFDDLDAALNA